MGVQVPFTVREVPALYKGRFHSVQNLNKQGCRGGYRKIKDRNKAGQDSEERILKKNN